MSTIRFGSNLASLNAQRRLGQATADLSRSYERLSSGLRINRAGDDAAGLAISDSLKTDQRVFNQGIRNFNDGISLLSIADSALEQMGNIVIRLRELAEQSANTVYGNSQRSALDDEAQALSREYLRIAQSAEFNDLDLFSGSLGSVRLQAGYGANGGIVSSLGGSVGVGTFATSTGTASAEASGDFNGDGNVDIVVGSGNAFAVRLGNGDGTFGAITSFTTHVATGLPHVAIGDFNGDGILDLVGQSPVNGAAIVLGNGDGTFRSPYSVSFGGGGGNYLIHTADLNGDGLSDLYGTGSSAQSRVDIRINQGNNTFAATSQLVVATGGPISLNEVVAADFNGDGIFDIASQNTNNTVGLLLGNGDGTYRAFVSFATGAGSASLSAGDFNADGRIDIATTRTGAVEVYFGTGAGTFLAAVSAANAFAGAINSGDFNGDGFSDLMVGTTSTNVLLSNGNGTFAVSYTAAGAPGISSTDFNNDGVLDATINGTAYLAGTTTGTGALLPFSLATVAGARQALPILERATQKISVQRGVIGAFESRLGTALNTLSVASENYAEAESRIRNVDVAQEAAQLVRLGILQKASAAVLAQANLQPERALSLLKSKK